MALRPWEAVDARRFIAMPANEPPAEAPRRIWETEPGTVFVALGVLLERPDLETVFLEVEHEDWRGCREDALLQEAVRLCACPCPFAEAVEELLDVRTGDVRRRVGGCPMAELAAWWMGVQYTAEGRQRTALLWSLARDRRSVVGPLFEMVRGDIWVRALRLLSESRGSQREKGEPVSITP